MPGLIQSYDVLLEFTNDTEHCTSLQLLREYNARGSAGAAVLVPPGEAITLVLDAGSAYHYVLKCKNKCTSVTARTWQDVKYPISQLFIPDSGGPVYGGGVTVDRVFRDMRCCISDWNDL